MDDLRERLVTYLVRDMPERLNILEHDPYLWAYPVADAILALVEAELADLRCKLEETAKGSHAYADDCEILRDENEDLRRKLDETDSTLGNCREGYEAATEAIAELNEELNEANAKLASLSLTNAALRTALRGMISIPAVLQVHGRDHTTTCDCPLCRATTLLSSLALPADGLAEEVLTDDERAAYEALREVEAEHPEKWVKVILSTIDRLVALAKLGVRP